MAIKLWIGENDATGLAASVSLSGSIKQCCRTLKAELLQGAYDKALPVTTAELGTLVRFYEDDVMLFYGSLFTVTMSTDSQTKSIVAFDMGYFLKNNYASYSFAGTEANAICLRVCRDHWIPVASLAAPGIGIRRKFANVTLDKIIDTAYTLSAEQTGKKYMTRFVGAALSVIEKGTVRSAIILEGVSNLQNLSYTYSSDGMVNAVKVYDNDGNLLQTRQNDKNPASRYGLRTRILTRREGDDVEKKIKALFEEHDLEKRITVNVLASNDMVTGNAVYLMEPHTGQKGVCWIDEDTHTWRGGLHTARLTLNFKNIVREADAGQEEKT